MRTRPLAALLALCAVLGGCREERRVKPELPESVTPGWKFISLETSTAPSYLPYPSARNLPASINTPAPSQQNTSAGSPDCWQAKYAGTGTAQILVCRYSAEPGAFDAVQRARIETQTVKFQQGEYLVLVKWDNTPKADLNSLMRAIQQALVKK